MLQDGRGERQGELISGDQNGSIKIWDLTANRCMHELVPAEGVPIRSISVAADGTLLVAANNKVRPLKPISNLVNKLLTEGRCDAGA